MDASTLIETEVRDLVRLRSIDPVRETQVLSDLVAAVVSDYDERALRGAVPRIDDLERVRADVVAAVGGLGPLQRYMDDDTVEEIWINSPTQIYVARNGAPELTTTVLSANQIRELVERMLAPTGRRIDMSSPFVDARLPDGSRLHVVIPEVTRSHWAINIRKFVARAYRLADLVALDTLTQEAADFLGAAVNSGLNIVVSGATGAGKSTLLNCLGASISARERVVTCEEVFELQLPVRDQVNLQCRQPNLEGIGEIGLRTLIKEALRMRPQRIVVGEVRQAESLDMLLALNAGMAGMSTIHANSARDAITKLCMLPMLAGPNITADFIVPTVAGCIDLVVHLNLATNGTRRVTEIVGISGRCEGNVVETATIFEDAGLGLQRAGGFPPKPENFARQGHDLAQLLRGES